MSMIRIVSLLLLIALGSAAQADERFITLSSTTSTQDSGLFDHILPIFRAATGLTVHVVAVDFDDREASSAVAVPDLVRAFFPPRTSPRAPFRQRGSPTQTWIAASALG